MMALMGGQCHPRNMSRQQSTMWKRCLQGLTRGYRQKCGTPLKSGYRPELDASPELKQDGLQRYQELIGRLCWAVELGRVDILLETALMSTHLALPRRGHLEQLYHIFGYLKAHPKRNLFFDPQHP